MLLVSTNKITAGTTSLSVRSLIFGPQSRARGRSCFHSGLTLSSHTPPGQTLLATIIGQTLLATIIAQIPPDSTRGVGRDPFL